jgi:hypothetical protein
MESALEAPIPEPSFTSPGWRRKLSWGTYLTAENMDVDGGAKVTAAIRKGARTPTISSQGELLSICGNRRANVLQLSVGR